MVVGEELLIGRGVAVVVLVESLAPVESLVLVAGVLAAAVAAVAAAACVALFVALVVFPFFSQFVPASGVLRSSLRLLLCLWACLLMDLFKLATS